MVMVKMLVQILTVRAILMSESEIELRNKILKTSKNHLYYAVVNNWQIVSMCWDFVEGRI